MEFKTIDQRFSTASQLNEADLEDAASQGFKLVINFRPDGEGGEAQPRNATLAAKAEALGLTYAYIPVIPNQIQPSQVDELRTLLSKHAGPTLGFCRTGNRANNVYQQAFPSDAMTKPDCCSQPQSSEDKHVSSRLMSWLKR
jgi:uncharacterized protein (TIGR01244 family)